MTCTLDQRRTTLLAQRGYTLVEMVLVLTIMTFVGGVASYVIVESMRVYARSAPALDAAYQARSSVERMKRDIRAMRDRLSLITMTSSSFSFQDIDDQIITYTFSGDTLTRNGNLMAEGVTAFELEYWNAGGTAAASTDDLHLVEIDLTVERGGQAWRTRAAVFPRVLSHD